MPDTCTNHHVSGRVCSLPAGHPGKHKDAEGITWNAGRYVYAVRMDLVLIIRADTEQQARDRAHEQTRTLAGHSTATIEEITRTDR